MFQSNPGVVEPLADDRLDGTAMSYSLVPRPCNLCRPLGREQGRIAPSRAFCSDEDQGCPIIHKRGGWALQSNMHKAGGWAGHVRPASRLPSGSGI